MSVALSFNQTVDLTVVRCFKCRRWYGFERNEDYGCPLCARDLTKALRDEIKKLTRANAALRGHARSLQQ